MGNPDTDSAPTVYHAGPPTLEGWMAFYRTPEECAPKMSSERFTSTRALIHGGETAWAMTNFMPQFGL